jgi:hypothetical protein
LLRPYMWIFLPSLISPPHSHIALGVVAMGIYTHTLGESTGAQVRPLGWAIGVENPLAGA